MGVTVTFQRMTQFGLLLSCDSNLKSDWDFQFSGSGSNSLNWRKLPGRFSLPKRPGNEGESSPVQSTSSPSLGPRLSPLKTGGGESPVTFARKAVDFRRVISHVINEGHSYFCGKCAIENIAFRFQGIPSFTEVRDNSTAT